MLGEEGLLVIKQHEFMLTGWICFICGGSCQVKEVKPALCTNSYHKVLSNREKKQRHTQCREHRHQCIHDLHLLIELTFPLLQTSPTATQVSCHSETHEMNKGNKLTMKSRAFSGLCTDHAHTGSCDPGFGVIILVHQQLSTGVPHNQLVQLQRMETDSTFILL